MKGSDCTKEQLAAAEQFLVLTEQKPGHVALDGEYAQIRRSELIRLLAWYGAIRHEAGVTLNGTTEQPAPVFAINPETEIKSTTPIEELELTVRAFNVLKTWTPIQTAEELSQWSREELLRLRNCGAHSVRNMEAALKQVGMRLKMSKPKTG